MNNHPFDTQRINNDPFDAHGCGKIEPMSTGFEQLNPGPDVFDVFKAGGKASLAGALAGAAASVFMTTGGFQASWTLLFIILTAIFGAIIGVLGWFVGRWTLKALTKTNLGRTAKRLVTSIASTVAGLAFLALTSRSTVSAVGWPIAVIIAAIIFVVFFVFIPQRELRRQK